MNWSNWTGLQPETHEEHKRITNEFKKAVGSLGRVAVVWLLFWTMLMTGDQWASELSQSTDIALTIIVAIATLWAFYPMLRAVYALGKMAWRAGLIGEASLDFNLPGEDVVTLAANGVGGSATVYGFVAWEEYF